MNRDLLLRIVIVGVGVALFFLLFFADKTNLNNEATATISEEEVVPADAASDLPEFTPDEQTQIWLEGLETAEESEKLSLLDSIINRLLTAQQYIFAADYAVQKVALVDNLPNRVEAGVISRMAMETEAIQGDTSLVNRFGRLAVGMLEPVVEREPENEDALLSLGLAYIRAVAPMQGILTVRKVVEINPANLEAQYRLGQFSLQTGQVDKAIERFEAVLSIDEDYYPAMYGLAIAAAQNGENDRARSLLEKVVAESPSENLKEEAEDLLGQLN